MTTAIDVGHVVGGKFELVRLLGRGSMGEVWVAHHRTLGEHVALKLLTSSAGGEVFEEDATAAARFLFEAQIAARLSRKTRHIVRVTDHGEEDGLAYLVMELLEGETLHAMLERSPGRLPADVVADVVTQLSRALTHAHAEGVFHRDLKPANVFVTHDEEGRRLFKVLDFGIARAIHAHRIRGAFSTAKGLVFGTPGYMSPEQARASSQLDHRCDLWALAVIAYEGLTGSLPMEGTDTEEILKNLCAGRFVSLRDRLPDASPALAGFFDRAFADRIEDRPSSAAELAQEFARAVEGGAAVEAPTSGPVSSSTNRRTADARDRATSLRPGPRRRRARVVLLSAAGLAAAVTVLGVAWRLLAPPASADPVAPGAAKAAGPVLVATPIAPPEPAEPQDAPPSVEASSLPRTPTHPLSAARGPVVPMVSSQPPALVPIAPTPSPSRPVAPHPQAQPQPAPKPRDKSEVL